ncbi:leucine-rich repeat protein [Metamycoplasma hyosynoviae]|uniref:leucine-rich repeat protein n=1 Tax=Metamycoplasma hyosynoviae TaxID=29559 RepID=UPI002359E489|nr:leucine-rich repeat protein [Metamycoplasma hyosynoviae]MDC8916827.1 leucine-rich repeat protein [Metamycoplasma hyosynoviae]
MKEQEQKQQIKKEELPKQVKQETKVEEKLQPNHDKVKTQNPKNKVIFWSAAGVATAALSSVVTFSTIFSNQRKVSFLDKVLQSIKIDVKDKKNKTKEEIKTIGDFVTSGLNNKLYELIVETEDDQVNKQPLDKDKPYTTFRTKFAIRNKYTKAQSNYRIFEFRDIKPPKEKAELDKLGQISTNEKDRINDKVLIQFRNFNRSTQLASEVAEKDKNGDFKHFYFKVIQDNNDEFRYEVVNVNVKTDDETSTAIFSYQIKVKSIDDDRFISNVLEVKFDDFAKTSTQLTQYLNELTFSYENASSVFPQDAIQTKVIAKNKGVNLLSNYELIFTEFKTEGEYPKKIDAIVKLRDNANNIISDSRGIEITGFKNYQTPNELNAYADKIKLDVENKNTKYISNINNYSQILINNFEDSKYEIDKDTFVIEKLEDLTSINVHFRIKEKHGRPEIFSNKKTTKIEGFKIPQRLLNEWASAIRLDVVDKQNQLAYNYWDDFSRITKENVNDKFEFSNNATVKQTSANELTVRFQIYDKNDSSVKSEIKEVKITGFKTENVNSEQFGYYLYDYNGHKVACLNKKKIENVFLVPSEIDSFKVKKATNLYVYENPPRHYCVSVAEGIEEVENLVYTNANATSDLLALSLPNSIKSAKNVIMGPTKNLLYFGMPSSIEYAQGLYESSNTTLESEHYFSDFLSYYGAENFVGKSWDPQELIHWKGGFKFELYNSENAKYKIKPDSDGKYSFLVEIKGNKLVKLIEKTKSPTDLYLNLDSNDFDGIVEGALYGSKAKKITLESNKISNLENLFSSSNSTLEELDLSKLTNFKYFDRLGPSFNNIKKVTLPDNMGENLKFNFIGWKSLEEVSLPKSVRYITSSMFYHCEKLQTINFDKLSNLEEIVNEEDLHKENNDLKHLHFLSSSAMTKIDLSKTRLKKLAGYAFAFVDNLEKIILPSTLEKVGRTIAYGTYDPKGTSNVEDDTIDFKNKLTIEIKNISSKPDGWHNRWIGQFWTVEKPSGTDSNKVEIKWDQI